MISPSHFVKSYLATTAALQTKLNYSKDNKENHSKANESL